jgi:hypothetical protein
MAGLVRPIRVDHDNETLGETDAASSKETPWLRRFRAAFCGSQWNFTRECYCRQLSWWVHSGSAEHCAKLRRSTTNPNTAMRRHHQYSYAAPLLGGGDRAAYRDTFRTLHEKALHDFPTLVTDCRDGRTSSFRDY